MNRWAPGWRFLDMGRRIEQGTSTSARFARIFATHDATVDDLDHGARSRRQPDHLPCAIPDRPRRTTLVRDMVVLDPFNPRSLAFQLVALKEHLAILPSLMDDGMMEAPRRILVASGGGRRDAGRQGLDGGGHPRLRIRTDEPVLGGQRSFLPARGEPPPAGQAGRTRMIVRRAPSDHLQIRRGGRVRTLRPASDARDLGHADRPAQRRSDHAAWRVPDRTHRPVRREGDDGHDPDAAPIPPDRGYGAGPRACAADRQISGDSPRWERVRE